MELIKVENVTKRYTGHTALDDVSLSVRQGSVYGLLGPNGAGKTTLIRIINHITAPDQGRVIFDGHTLVQDDVKQIGYLPEERGLYKKMRVGEQAMFFARLKGLSRRDAYKALRQWFEKFDILPWWDKKVEELSKGMAQKVQFIVTVLHRPKLLIFDEPFSGFDPINAELLKNEILALRDEGSTIIFSTHNMASVEVLCDDITLINKSRNILSGNVEEIRRRHSQGRYAFTIASDPNDLLSALSGYIDHYTITEQGDEKAILDLRLHDDAEMRSVIDLANKSCRLISFAPIIPSMDDIFIHTVNNYNRNNNEQ